MATKNDSDTVVSDVSHGATSVASVAVEMVKQLSLPAQILLGILVIAVICYLVMCLVPFLFPDHEDSPTCGSGCEDYAQTPFCSMVDGNETCVACYRDDHCTYGQCVLNQCIQHACISDVDCMGSLECNVASGTCEYTSLVTNPSSCSQIEYCGDGHYCSGNVCVAHDAAPGTFVAQDDVLFVTALSQHQVGSLSLTTIPNPYRFAFSLHPSNPNRFEMYLHYGKQSHRATFSTVYWYEPSTGPELDTFLTTPRYIGQALTDNTYIAIAHRNGDRVSVLRVYDPQRPQYVSIGSSYIQASVTRLAPGVQGFTHVLWVV